MPITAVENFRSTAVIHIAERHCVCCREVFNMNVISDAGAVFGGKIGAVDGNVVMHTKGRFTGYFDEQGGLWRRLADSRL